MSFKKPADETSTVRSLYESYPASRRRKKRLNEQDEPDKDELFNLSIRVTAVEMSNDSDRIAGDIFIKQAISDLEDEFKRTKRSDIRKAIGELKKLEKMKIKLPKVWEGNVDVEV